MLVKRITELTTEIWVEEDRNRNINVPADICGGSVVRGPQTTVGFLKIVLFVLAVAISLEPLELRPTLLYSDMKYLISFLMTLKCASSDDLVMQFYAKT